MQGIQCTRYYCYSIIRRKVYQTSHKGAENKLECLRTVALDRRCSVKKLFLDIS